MAGMLAGFGRTMPSAHTRAHRALPADCARTVHALFKNSACVCVVHVLKDQHRTAVVSQWK
eukprot:12750135-Alexandrium_andersonii.AAC.1